MAVSCVPCWYSLSPRTPKKWTAGRRAGSTGDKQPRAPPARADESNDVGVVHKGDVRISAVGLAGMPCASPLGLAVAGAACVPVGVPQVSLSACCVVSVPVPRVDCMSFLIRPVDRVRMGNKGHVAGSTSQIQASAMISAYFIFSRVLVVSACFRSSSGLWALSCHRLSRYVRE